MKTATHKKVATTEKPQQQKKTYTQHHDRTRTKLTVRAWQRFVTQCLINNNQHYSLDSPQFQNYATSMLKERFNQREESEDGTNKGRTDRTTFAERRKMFQT